MHESDRAKLLFGPYRQPRCKVGQLLRCAMRGKVRVAGIHEALIPWPYTLRAGGGRPMLILCGDLAYAVRHESEVAICHWWGVGVSTVSGWRKVLGVGHGTPGTVGTSALRSRWAPETVQSEESNRKRMPTLKSPERAAKIAASKRGRPRPASVVEALRKANTGKKATAETRAKMSHAHKLRCTRPPAAGAPWTVDEDGLLGTMKDADVATRTGRSKNAVSHRRKVLGIGAFTKRSPRGEPILWTSAKDRLLGSMSDGDVARKLRCAPMTVFYRRKRLKIAAYRG